MYFHPVLLLLKVLHVSIRLFAAFAPTAAAGGVVILGGRGWSRLPGSDQ